MRIGINLVQMWPGKIGGMEQYLRSLIEYASRFSHYEIYLFLNEYSYNEFQLNNKYVKKILMNLKENRISIDTQFHNWISKLNIRLWFCPLFTLMPKNVNIPSVVLIPDIQHEFFPQFFSPEDLQWRKSNIRHAAKAAAVILTISNFSRNTIIEKYKIREDKVVAIYGDAPKEFRSNNTETVKAEVIKKYHLPREYGLYPANTWPHKNHLNLLKTLVMLRDQYNVKINLVFTGYKQAHTKNYEEIQRFLLEKGVSSQVKFLGYVQQEEMPYLYLNSKFLVYPSLFEGFGIPLVEAMRTNTPIICSNAASIPEVVGDSALIFNPHDPKDIAIKMLEVLKPETSQTLITKGKEQAKKFSWKKSAKETLEVFRQLIENK
ncbi:glycosyltransferase family 4 protein [Priestia abyssalis]|uniref:glycosyltransferase family 4 protein n=1 Tax=Priestia abyssalis TaxID=1221450 RepID=UPI000994CC3D|nr:glycosyltransferase family 1 protein [Priestia abyssalis]